MIFKFRGKRYRWRLEDMDARLLLGLYGIAGIFSAYVWFIAIRMILVIWG